MAVASPAQVTRHNRVEMRRCIGDTILRTKRAKEPIKASQPGQTTGYAQPLPSSDSAHPLQPFYPKGAHSSRFRPGRSGRIDHANFTESSLCADWIECRASVHGEPRDQSGVSSPSRALAATSSNPPPKPVPRDSEIFVRGKFHSSCRMRIGQQEIAQ